MLSKHGLLSMVAIFSLGVAHVFGEVVPEYPCYRLAAAPVMDGKADDAVWQQLPESGNFFILNSSAYAIEKRTFFRAGWTEDSLYLCIKCFEPLPEKTKASAADGGDVWADDSIEMFFQPAGGPDYFQLIANSLGTRWNSVSSDAKDTKLRAWEVRSGKWEKGWLLEIRIPFAVLKKTPAGGDEWPVNIARNTTTGPAVERFTCWPPSLNGFSDLKRFGRFVFSAEAPSAQLGKKDEGRYLKEQCAAKIKAAKQPELMAALDNPALATEAKPIREALERLTALAVRPNAEPSDMATMLATWRNLMDSLTEKASKLGISLAKISKLSMTLKIKARQAKDVKLWVNGQAVREQDGKWPISICEGLNVIAMTAAADGQNPGLRLRIPDQPELESRWRVGNATNDSWLTGTFDDRSWKKTELDKKGYLLMPQGSTGDVCFRQIVLWGENHYSGLPCLQPKVREWGFSEKSLETLFHVLYSPPPLTFALEDYEFVLDVPKGFSLLEQNYDDPTGGGPYNQRPQKVTVEKARHDNQPYTRYRFAFEAGQVGTNTNMRFRKMALIPLVLNEFKGKDKTCRFYFRRMASGNLTELEQVLPVRVLPPLNGRMPKKVGIQQYWSVPWVMPCTSETFLYPEHFEAHMRQSLDVGFNRWCIGAWMGEYGKKVYNKVIERGGSVVLDYYNYPLHGNVCLGTNSALGKLMMAAPEARARYFNDGVQWNIQGQYCRSFVTGPGVAQFKEAVKNDIGLMLHGGTNASTYVGFGSAKNSVYIGFPKASIYWVDWEQEPWKQDWTAGGWHPSKEIFCLCENCKKAFRQYAKLPDTTDLSDDAIFKNYKREWSAFRVGLDGRVNGIVREACNELGLKYMYYDMVAYRDNWPPLKGKIDIIFPGLPGGDVCYGNRQAHVDENAKFIREEVGMPRVIGQQFAAGYNGKFPWDNWISRQEKDGFFIPKMVKLQILRIVATVHGGIDLKCSFERCAGMLYYIGEATRIISEYEDLFWDGKRADQLAASDQIKYPNLLVLKKDKERLVLLFNEESQPIRVILENKELEPGQKAKIFGSDQFVEQPGKMELSVDPEDVAIVNIQ